MRNIFDGNIIKTNDIFAKMERYAPDEYRNDKLSGLFFAGFLEDNKDIKFHNEAITSFISKYFNIYKKFLNDKNNKISDDLNKVTEEVESFIKNPRSFTIKTETLTKNKITSKNKNQENSKFSRDNINTKLFRVSYVESSEPEDITIYYYNDDNFMKSLEDKEYSEKLLRIKLAILKDMLNFAQDEEVKKWISEIIKIENKLNEYGYKSIIYKPIKHMLDRVLSILEIDLFLRTEDEQNYEDTNKDEYFDRPLLSKIAIGNRKLSFNDIVDRLIENGIVSKDSFEETMQAIKEFTGVDFTYLIKSLYIDDPSKNNEFLKKLGEEFERYLELSIQGKTRIKTIQYKKDKEPIMILEGSSIKVKNGVKFIILYEKTFNEEQANEFDKIIKNYINEGSRYFNLSELASHYKENPIRKIALEDIFTKYQDIKSKDGKIFAGDDGITLTNFILQVASFFLAISSYKKSHDVDIIVISLVDKRYRKGNKELNTEKFNFWDIVRALSSMMGFSLQTINTSSDLNDIKKFSKESYFKNMFLSALKDIKEVEISIDNSPLIQNLNDANVYFIIEHPSYNLYNKNKTFFYEVMNITFDKKKKLAKIKRFKDKKTGMSALYLIPGEKKCIDDIKEFFQRKGGDNTYKFVLISYPDSPVLDIIKQHYHDDCYYILYRSIKTPAFLKFTKSKGSEKGYLIYNQDLEKGLKNVNIPNIIFNKINKNYYGIKPPMPNSIFSKEERFNNIINTEISLFFPEDRLNDISLLNLSILSSLLWLMYRTETYSYVISKPKFLPKSLPNIKLKRNISATDKPIIQEYRFDTFSCICELSILLERLYMNSDI